MTEYIYERKAHYHETDKMGIIHHSNYIKWMEEARVAFMDAMGFSYKKAEELGIASPVVGLSIDYKSPVSFDDEILIKVSIKKYTGAVLVVGYEFTNKATSVLCAVAESKHCFISGGKIIALRRNCKELDEILKNNTVC